MSYSPFLIIYLVGVSSKIYVTNTAFRRDRGMADIVSGNSKTGMDGRFYC
jgi:hypothetical protein